MSYSKVRGFTPGYHVFSSGGLQQGQEYGMINRCNRSITLRSDTDIYFVMLLASRCIVVDSKQQSKYKRIFQDILNRINDISVSL